MSSFAEEHAPPGIPNGWFAVAFSKDLLHGEVKRIRYFDEEMVLFRGRSGKAYVLDAYCPHLGAHLAEGGRVMGEAVRCPFHGWQYDGGSGECTEIPYCKRIPPEARVRKWDVLERNAMIFVWHHAEGKPPFWEMPEIPEIGHEDWTEPRYFEIEVPVHQQDMHENNLDPVHFQFVHGMPEFPDNSEISYGENGRFMRVQHTSEQQTPAGSFELTLIRESWGMGLTSVRTTGIPGAGLLMYSSTSAIGREESISRWVFTVTRNMADIAGEEWINSMSNGVFDDMRIWKNKVHRANPVLCEADKQLAEFRKWSKQFYSDPT
jgi:phenylpropionate dioxygenase-like ring-hydroxylating dioxygenase large terminal subunit